MMSILAISIENGHTLTLQEIGFTVATGANFSYNYAASSGSVIWGPTLNLSKLFFKKILRTNWGLAYNTCSSLNKSISIFNLQLAHDIWRRSPSSAESVGEVVDVEVRDITDGSASTAAHKQTTKRLVQSADDISDVLPKKPIPPVQ